MDENDRSRIEWSPPKRNDGQRMCEQSWREHHRDEVAKAAQHGAKIAGLEAMVLNIAKRRAAKTAFGVML